MGAMTPLSELLNHFFAKRREIIGFAGGDKAVVGDNLFVDPVCTSVLPVGERARKSSVCPERHAH